MSSTNILNTDEIDLCEDYKTYFSEFIGDLKKIEDENEYNIKQLINDFSKKLVGIIDFDKIKPSGTDKYSRHCLGRHSSGWELLVMCWSGGQVTSIHGHPYICSYNFTQGEFELEIFDLNSDGNVVLNKIIEVSGKEMFTDVGVENSFSNHIHRIKCKSEIGHSIHIYSDDARKGIVLP